MDFLVFEIPSLKNGDDPSLHGRTGVAAIISLKDVLTYLLGVSK